MVLPQKLYRKPIDDSLNYITKAVLRHDGVHFVDRDNKERKTPEYKSLEEMNRTLKQLGFGTFEVVARWPLER